MTHTIKCERSKVFKVLSLGVSFHFFRVIPHFRVAFIFFWSAIGGEPDIGLLQLLTITIRLLPQAALLFFAISCCCFTVTPPLLLIVFKLA